MMRAIVLPSRTEADRWYVCRLTPQGACTVDTDCPTEPVARREAVRLQREFDAVKHTSPDRRLVAGFYTDEDAA